MSQLLSRRNEHDSGSPERPTVLYICHNHPSVRPGGAETYALELHRHISEAGDLDSVFLAKGGPPLSTAGRSHPGTLVAPIDNSDSEYFFFTEDWNSSYNWTFGTIGPDKQIYTKHLRAFLEAVQPDLVHLHHTLFFGYDVLREIKNTVPDAPIVYTLHEFMPICHRDGQMVRVVDDKPCMEESPRRCNECFPDISPQTFFMRKRFIQSHLELVDRFIAPSAFLAERYIDWGIPREKVVVEEYGRTPPSGEAPSAPREHRDRFGFFGQLSPYKGLQVLLEAMAELNGGTAEAGDPLLDAIERVALGAPPSPEPADDQGPRPRLWIHGANLDIQQGGFQNRIRELLDRADTSVTFAGRYEQSELASHVANIDWVIVPSIWWENSPLVIQEAFHFGRPVICSDIGGMAEKVTDGVDGLHFRANDPISLAAVLTRAAEEPGLWDRLRSGIKPVYPMREHARVLSDLYTELLHEGVMVHAG